MMLEGLCKDVMLEGLTQKISQGGSTAAKPSGETSAIYGATSIWGGEKKKKEERRGEGRRGFANL